MKAPCLRCGQLQKMMEGMDEAMQGSAAERDALTAENARLAMHIKHIGNDALRSENASLRMDKDVLLGHIDTISKCTNDPAISSLARVVLERFEAQKAEK